MKMYLITLLLLISFPVFAQQNLADRIRNKQFVFVATSMSSSGGFKLLNSPYDVTINGDSFESFLPYSGNSTTSMGNGDNLRFTATKFSYTVKESRKGFQIDINIPDQDARQYSFFILKNGTATLDVISTRKDAVSYRGYFKNL